MIALAPLDPVDPQWHPPDPWLNLGLCFGILLCPLDLLPRMQRLRLRGCIGADSLLPPFTLCLSFQSPLSLFNLLSLSLSLKHSLSCLTFSIIFIISSQRAHFLNFTAAHFVCVCQCLCECVASRLSSCADWKAQSSSVIALPLATPSLLVSLCLCLSPRCNAHLEIEQRLKYTRHYSAYPVISKAVGCDKCRVAGGSLYSSSFFLSLFLCQSCPIFPLITSWITLLQA